MARGTIVVGLEEFGAEMPSGRLKWSMTDRPLTREGPLVLNERDSRRWS